MPLGENSYDGRLLRMIPPIRGVAEATYSPWDGHGSYVPTYFPIATIEGYYHLREKPWIAAFQDLL